jgi:hypothetical protein
MPKVLPVACLRVQCVLQIHFLLPIKVLYHGIPEWRLANLFQTDWTNACSKELGAPAELLLTVHDCSTNARQKHHSCCTHYDDS